MKLYTKAGDSGTTSLTGGGRVSKADAQVEAYGSVDELMATVALLADTLHSRGIAAPLVADLQVVVGNLMSISAIISQGEQAKLPDLPKERVEVLEMAIDRISAQLKPLTTFTLPGGDVAQSMCHLSRTVCRRAERRMVAAERIGQQWPLTLSYVNRLSDYLYVAGRNVTELLKIEEKCWVF